MADAIYPKYKEALLSGAADVALDSSTVKVSLIDANTDVYSSTDQYYSDLDANCVIGSAELANTSVTNGVFNADPVEVPLSSDSDIGNTDIEALLLWIDTGNTETSRLVAWLDDSIVGIPFTPADGFVDVSWNDSGIFRL